MGQPRQQAVLGILAMRANRVISRGELVDAVWGQDPPASAEGGIYTYVAGLRRVIEPNRSLRGPGRVLVSSGAGYVLHLVPGQPDAVAFEQDLGRARQLRKAGDLVGAVIALNSALSLWRGIAFAGVPGPFAETERVRLGELRSAAAEERADVLLSLGRHEEVVPDLTAMVADHPLRERMRGLLMIALYRCGRHAEALRVFQDGRRVLAEELGIDPGGDLSRIHQQVLTMDPALAAPDGPAVVTRDGDAERGPASALDDGQRRLRPGMPEGRVTPVPAQLPLDAPGFSGRHEELSMLQAMLPAKSAGAAGEAAGEASRSRRSADPSGSRAGPDQTVPIVVISGTAGTGKTALAVRFGRQVARRFPGGQLYINLRGLDPATPPMEPAEALRFFLDALGVPPHRIPADTDGRSALFRSLLDGKRMLIVLDNARNVAQVRPLLPGSPGSLVVVTSRNEMTGLVAAEGAVPLTLDVLSDAEAHEMLARRLGQDRVAAEPEAADEIIASCARLPLALGIAVGRAAARPKRPLTELAAELRDARGRLDALEAGDAVTNVRAVLSWSYDQLSEPAARMFRLLGVHPGPDISLSAAASLAGMARADAGAALRELARTHMVAEYLPARFTFHDLLRAYAADQAERHDPEPERRAAVHRVLDHYLHTAMAASQPVQPVPVPAAARRPAAGRAARRRGGQGPGDGLVRRRGPGAARADRLRRRQRLRHPRLADPLDARPVLQPARPVAGLRPPPSRSRWPRPAAWATRSPWRTRIYLLGHVQSQMGDYEAADPNFRRALDVFRELGDRANEAVVLNGLAGMLEKQERYPEALAVALDALRMLKAVGHWWTQATLENGVGWLYAHLGQYDRALTHCQRALSLHRDSGHRGGTADTLDSLGFVYLHLGDIAQAKVHYTKAIEAYREIGAPFGEGNSLAGLGDALLAEGDPRGRRGGLARGRRHPRPAPAPARRRGPGQAPRPRRGGQPRARGTPGHPGEPSRARPADRGSHRGSLGIKETGYGDEPCPACGTWANSAKGA